MNAILRTVTVTAVVVGAVLASLLLIACHARPSHHRSIASQFGIAATGGRGGRAEAPPGALPALDEEIWVIVRPGNEIVPAAPVRGEDVPGYGALMGRGVGGGEGTEVPLPLRHTEVEASITAYIAQVNVRQEYHNPFAQKIEALYVFPLPQNAAVSEFVMTVGERRIRGIVRERQEAERIYAEARQQGYVASLLTQERPNIFTQAVANIEPGRRIDIDITYFHTLRYVDGWYEYVFPMVVGPRFNPPGFASGIGAVPRGGSGTSDQPVEVSYLHPSERNGHDIALRVAIDAGVPIEELTCRSHRIMTSGETSTRRVATLDARDRIPNKDFVLRYRVAGDTVQAGLLTHQDERGGFFTVLLVPPLEIRSLAREPVEMVFVVDCSGSMEGRPLEQAKRAVVHALRGLREDDTFQVIRFSMKRSAFARNPVPATRRDVDRGIRYVNALNAGGGTMMVRGIRAALGLPPDPQRPRFVVFLTDGYIGNEAEILGEIQRSVGSARIFSFGVGSSPNRYLMNRMAKLGRGAVAYLGLDDSAAEVMDGYLNRIRHPAMTDLSIEWGDANVRDTMPARLPDLFVGRPVVVTGRFDGAAPSAARIRGNAAGVRVETTVTAGPPTETPNSALPAVWARMHIADLMDHATGDHDPVLPDRIEEVAMEYGLMSAYTAFIAVDSSRGTEGEHGTTVPVAVPVPEGVRYETTVAERGSSGGGAEVPIAGVEGRSRASGTRDEP